MAAVLVVEDDETIGSLLESALRMHDYDVMWFEGRWMGVRSLPCLS